MSGKKKNLSSAEFANLTDKEKAGYDGNDPKQNQALGHAYRNKFTRTSNGETTNWYPQFSENEMFGSNLIVQPSYDKDGKLVTFTPKGGQYEGEECVWLNVMMDKSLVNLENLDKKVQLGQERAPLVSPYFETHKEARVVDGTVKYGEGHSTIYKKKDLDAIVAAAGDNKCIPGEYTIGHKFDKATQTQGEAITFKCNGEVYGVRAPIRDCFKQGGQARYKVIVNDTKGNNVLSESKNVVTPEKFQNQIDYCNKVRQNVIDLHIAQRDNAGKSVPAPTTPVIENAVSDPVAEKGEPELY